MKFELLSFWLDDGLPLLQVWQKLVADDDRKQSLSSDWQNLPSFQIWVCVSVHPDNNVSGTARR